MPHKPPTIRRRRVRRAQPPDTRQSAARRGYDCDHQRWRDVVLRRDPLCVKCLHRGRIEPATIADHIQPISQAPDRRLEVDNGRGLCRDCHQQITARLRAEGINEMPGESP